MTPWKPTFVLLTGLAVASACSREPDDAAERDQSQEPDDRRDAAAGKADAASLEPPFETGPASAELLISLTNGQVMWWRADNTGAQLLESNIQGPAFGMALDAAANLYVTHGFTPDLEAGNAIEVFDPEGNRVGELGTGFDCNPHSVVFDDMQRAYVGQADCGADILQLDSAGTLLQAFDVATEERGTDWIALAEDQCTIAYTSQGPNVKRYDACTNAQLEDFNVAPLPVNTIQGSGAQELKFLPGGGLIVANFTEIVLLDDAGVQKKVYDMEGPDGWRGLDLDADGTSFWTANYSTSDIVRFDIASGKILELFNTGTPLLTVKSVLVKRPSSPP